MPGSRIVAPRGTRLTMRTPLFSVSVSRYSPGSTTIVVPGRARSSASAIDCDGSHDDAVRVDRGRQAHDGLGEGRHAIGLHERQHDHGRQSG